MGAGALVCMVAATGLLATSPAPIYLATLKTSLTFSEAFTRGVLANWLVGHKPDIWNGSADTVSHTATSKIIH